jgi:hypothetical protein
MGLDYRTSRLLARVLKVVQKGRPILVQRYIYSKGGGGGTITLLHISICSKLVRNFSNTLCFLYLTTTFSFSQVHHQFDQNVKCIIIMRIEAILFQI